jgi:LAGLIDADG-like domain
MPQTLKKQFPISWDYLVGLIETDGSFQISLNSQGLYKPTVSISQKTNTGLLENVQTFLTFFEIKATDISNAQRSNRAPKLRIQGADQIRFCELLEKNVKGSVFCSQKFRDFLIMKTALYKPNRKLDFAKKIDLVLSLHKTHLNQPDIACYNTKTSRDHELRLGLRIRVKKQHLICYKKSI